jgi:RecB family exonuclease
LPHLPSHANQLFFNGLSLSNHPLIYGISSLNTLQLLHFLTNIHQHSHLSSSVNVANIGEYFLNIQLTYLHNQSQPNIIPSDITTAIQHNALQIPQDSLIITASPQHAQQLAQIFPNNNILLHSTSQYNFTLSHQNLNLNTIIQTKKPTLNIIEDQNFIYNLLPKIAQNPQDYTIVTTSYHNAQYIIQHLTFANIPFVNYTSYIPINNPLVALLSAIIKFKNPSSIMEFKSSLITILTSKFCTSQIHANQIQSVVFCKIFSLSLENRQQFCSDIIKQYQFLQPIISALLTSSPADIIANHFTMQNTISPQTINTIGQLSPTLATVATTYACQSLPNQQGIAIYQLNNAISINTPQVVLFNIFNQSLTKQHISQISHITQTAQTVTAFSNEPINQHSAILLRLSQFAVINLQTTQHQTHQLQLNNPSAIHSTFPTKLSLTAISKLVQNPAYFYFKYLLKLRHTSMQSSYYQDRGIVIHDIAQIISESLQQNKPQPHITATINSYIASQNLHFANQMTIANISQSILSFCTNLKNQGYTLHSEQEDSINIENTTITAKADLIISLGNNLTIYDYKTGSVPSFTDEISGKSPQLILESLIHSTKSNISINDLAYLYYSKGIIEQKSIATSRLKSYSLPELQQHIKQQIINLINYYTQGKVYSFNHQYKHKNEEDTAYWHLLRPSITL